MTFFWFLEWDVVWTGRLDTLLLGFQHYPRAATAPAAASHENRTAPNSPMLAMFPPADLLCPAPTRTNKKWPHMYKRNQSRTPWQLSFHCVTEVMRMSRVLLEDVYRHSQHAENGMFCELRAATVCSMRQALEEGSGELLVELEAITGRGEAHLSTCTKPSATCGQIEDISRGGCRMASLFDDEHAHLLFSSYANGTDGAEVRVPVRQAKDRWVGSFAAEVPRAVVERNRSRDMLFHAYKWHTKDLEDPLYQEELTAAQREKKSTTGRRLQGSGSGSENMQQKLYGVRW